MTTENETADERAEYLHMLEALRVQRDELRRRRRYLDALEAHLWLRMMEKAWM